MGGHGHRSLAEKKVYNAEEDAHGWLVNQYSLSPVVSCLDLRVHVAVVVLLSLHVMMLSSSDNCRSCDVFILCGLLVRKKHENRVGSIK